MNQKNEKGITLIALVITIIVLLILAGVTISMVLGDDGIKAQAQQAKEEQKEAEQDEQKEAEQDEQNALDIGAGNIDLSTVGTVANTVKVGDYVEYNYIAPEDGYTTPEAGTGKEVNSTTEKYDSSLEEDAEDGTKAAKVSKWRVLSKKDGIVKLVAETPINSELILYGTNGWGNGPTVLNEMCKTLYSSDIGTARSINVEDVNEITKYDGTKYYYTYDGDEVTISADETKTIAEAAKTAGSDGTGYDMDNFASEVPEEGKNIGDYEVNYYSYDADGSHTNKWLTADKEEYKMLFGEDDMYYWLASSCVRVYFSHDYAFFRVRYVYDGDVTTCHVFSSDGYAGSSANAVRPVVTLKSGLEIDSTDSTRDGSSVAPWQIKGN